jgi:cytoskeletal protein CcmA (bactofilin family)
MAELNHRDHTTILGPDTLIKGEMSFDSSVCILGRFEGRIISKGVLEIGESAICKASIDAARVIVEGTVEGDIIARERLELHAGASVTGDIAAVKLIAAEGASFVGQCRVGESAIKPEATTAPAARPAATGLPVERPARRPAVAPITPSSSEIEATIAGFEAKLAEFGKAKPANGTLD